MRSRLLYVVLAVIVCLSLFALPALASTPPSGTWVLVAQGVTTWHAGGGAVAWLNYYTTDSAYYMFTTTNLTYSGASGTVKGGIYGGNRNFTQSKTSPYSNFFRTDPNLLSGGALMTDERTWFSHWFRGGGGPGFPYPIGGKEIDAARKYSKDL